MLLLTIMASNETNAIWEILKPIDFGKNWRAFILLVCFSRLNFTFISTVYKLCANRII